MNRSFLRIRAFFLVSIIWAAIGFSLGFLRPVDRSLGIELPPWVRIPATIVIGVGGTLMMTCGLMLSTVGVGTIPNHGLLPRDFIAHGPFRFVRNPMSLGGITLMTGLALWHRSTLALFAAAALFVVLHLMVTLLEEPGLKRRFGDSYIRYINNVARWIPRLSPWMPERTSEARAG